MNPRVGGSIRLYHFDGSVQPLRAVETPLSRALSGFRSLYVLRPLSPKEWF